MRGGLTAATLVETARVTLAANDDRVVNVMDDPEDRGDEGHGRSVALWFKFVTARLFRLFQTLG